MSRNPPTQLPDPQRNALSEFLAGHISAGELSDRVRPQSRPSPQPTPRSRYRRRTRRTAAIVVVAAIAGVAVAVAVGSSLFATAHPGTAAVRHPTIAKRAARHQLRRHGLPAAPLQASQAPQPTRAAAPGSKSAPRSRHPAAQPAPKQHRKSAGTVGFSASAGPTFTSPPTTTSVTTTAPSTTTGSTPTTTTTATPTTATTTAPGTTSAG